ncbi:hypothetical protein I79_021560 [Cricetulus griseus]|uniref:Uncharacterized protein n=1 Tax=Cricetulus griseus TaxID=10029 RepID=G3ICZ9_CRIGR|nr:hypothetical protein I79_021560 [Cricetulus griseus]
MSVLCLCKIPKQAILVITCSVHVRDQRPEGSVLHLFAANVGRQQQLEPSSVQS